MDRETAKVTASTLKRLGVTVLGYQKDSLVVRYDRRRFRLSREGHLRGLMKELKLLTGHQYEAFDICSICYGKLRANLDGHYHSCRGAKEGPAVGVCCRCVIKSGGDCTLVFPSKPEMPVVNQAELERQIQESRAEKRIAKRERRLRRQREKAKLDQEPT